MASHMSPMATVAFVLGVREVIPNLRACREACCVILAARKVATRLPSTKMHLLSRGCVR